ncbi:hypothetical protein KY315_02485 [Candidatus Woesearchaeota archaeon]|nr:hypothetical protein [Candidatus Woesearchaeota archaeon]
MEEEPIMAILRDANGNIYAKFGEKTQHYELLGFLIELCRAMKEHLRIDISPENEENNSAKN